MNLNDIKKIDICGLELNEFGDIIKNAKEKLFRAKQIYNWIFKKGVKFFDGMTDLPAALRPELALSFNTGRLKIIGKKTSADKAAIKYAMELADGNIVETVKIYDNNELDKYSVCVSTQVGCPVNCVFCQTAKMGFIRNLSAAEITAQILETAFDDDKFEPEGLSNIVYMGMGEPLLNYDNVLKSIKIINSPDALNISMRKITVSTAGIVPAIKKLAAENIPVTLAVSLHAPCDELRNKLVPLNKKYNIKTIVETIKEYTHITGRRVTIEYVIIDGINDKKNDALKMAELFKNTLCHVNLIPLNAAENNYRPPSKKKIFEFKNTLLNSGINATIRNSKGQDISAACGMLYKEIKTNRLHENNNNDDK